MLQTNHTLPTLPTPQASPAPQAEPAAGHPASGGVIDTSGAYAAARFVLVEPSHPGNVGAAARALKTMGFSRLVLVSPRVPEVLADPEAIAMASGADDVLAAARIVPTLAEALAGVQWSIALTARSREYGPPRLAPRAAAEEACRQASSGDMAFVFGNERTGLSNEHVDLCSAIAHIPANPDYSSLNLAQAIQVLAYEMRIALLSRSPEQPEAAAGTLASSEEIEQMFAHLQSALVALDFLDPRNPKKLMPRLRRLFSRSGLEPEEVNILRGIAKHILLKTGDGHRCVAGSAATRAASFRSRILP
ncbi:MAG: tRNA (cytidine/uridine-2'-O-)-methyltransferase TrmJ [Burkholderia plantarii]|nr:MAG: tRNA (cytidine/uridine-2'-O-)-methyltransferase TrmJ [Burkholderia plantarii]